MTISRPIRSRIDWPERIIGSGLGAGDWGFDTNFGAESVHRADRALWFSSDADLPTMMDHSMSEIDPLTFRQQFHQLLFDFYRVGVLGKSQSAAHSRHMRINNNARRHPKGGAEHNVRRFS